MNIVVVTDNLRIGGIERLSLDQCYAMRDMKMSFQLIVLDMENTLANPNFIAAEEDLFKSKIERVYFPKKRGRIREILFFRKHFVYFKTDLVIVHSLRAAVEIKIACLFLKNRPQSHVTIHQLPVLSSALQRLKRSIYSQFCDRLFAYSSAVKLSWERNSSSSAFARIFLNKEIEVLRNGIYLDRLPTSVTNANQAYHEFRLVFFSRLRSWKGPNRVISIAKDLSALHKAKLLFMTPARDENFEEFAIENLGDRIQFVYGKTLANYEPMEGDIHIYPVDYGSSNSFIESVSLNCLEMACLGVASIVTQGGLGTWPELADLGCFLEVEWSNREATIESVLRFTESPSTWRQDLEKLRSLISIENNVRSHIESANITLMRE